MKKVLRITNPNVYAAYVNAPPLHPLLYASSVMKNWGSSAEA